MNKITKKRSRIISILITLSLVIGLFGAMVPKTESQAAPEVQTRTVMMYCVGSGLESGSGLATKNLLQAMRAEYDENLNYIVMTGGAKEWKTEPEYLDGAVKIDTEYDQIWSVKGKKDGEEHGMMTLLEATGIAGYEKANMSKPETLTAFMDYCYDNYPADQYDIIFWDHGAGVTGFGMDDNYNTGWLSLEDMVDSLEASDLIKDGKTFEIINFDACLMSSVEVISSLADYTEYFVGSAEMEPGDGQEYTSWLNAVKNNPSMNGFELGKTIVDGFVKYYDAKKSEATLSVISSKNFKERLIKNITDIDKILIKESKNVGKRNNRYNFYDELYSMEFSYKYCSGSYCMYDLGNFVGALSAPQSEMNNLTQSQIDRCENSYTDAALRILQALNDDDGSSDDVIYTGKTQVMKKTIPQAYIRDLDGNIMSFDNTGKMIIKPTGMNMLLGDENIDKVFKYMTQLSNAIPKIKDRDVQRFLAFRAISTMYYSLIVKMGKTVSTLSDKGVSHISFNRVKNYLKSNSNDWNEYCQPFIDCITESGEFTDAEDMEDYLSAIVAQQSSEVVSKEKVEVKQIKNYDAKTGYYKVTVGNTSSQAFMSVDSSNYIKCRNYNSAEVKEIFSDYYGEEIDINELYPDGITFRSAANEGDLDIAFAMEDIDDTSAELYQRIYSSTYSTWKVPDADGKCFVLYDKYGNSHIADIHYLDKSYKKAYVPIALYRPKTSEKDIFYRWVNLIISYSDNRWKVDGLVPHEDEIIERSYISIDGEFFADLMYTTAACMKEPKYNFSVNMPVSSFTDCDITEENWGISFGYESYDDIDDVASHKPAYHVADVYGYDIDVTENFAQADINAADGDAVYEIDQAEVEVAPVVYNGYMAKPEVTVTYAGKELEPSVDYKVIYDGSTQPGKAYLYILGIGDYIGTRSVAYNIEKENKTTDFKIKIVHTNDIHARIEESNRDGIIGAEKLKTIIDDFTKDSDMSLVLDSGDLYHGLPIATVSEGESIANIVAALGYDAMTVGNHDWNYGQDRLKELIAISNLKMLTGNVVDEDGEKFFDDEFLIKTVTKDGRTIKVGIFGVVDPAIYRMTAPSLLQGLKYTDPVRYANNAAKTLKDLGCDIVIGLTHTYKPADFAENVNGVDMWLAGHEHIVLSKEVTSGTDTTRVYEEGYYMYDVGCYEIDVQASDSGIDCSYSANRLTYEDVINVEKDAGITALLADINADQEAVMSTKAGYSPAALDGVWEHLRCGETNLGRAVTSAYILQTGADIALENAGGIRASVAAGDLTYKSIIAVSPYGNIIVTKKMQGRDIRALFEDNIELELQCIAADESGEYDAWPHNSGSYLQIGGARVLYNPTLEKGKRILSVTIGGKALDEDAYYTVATNNYLADSTGLPLLGNAEKLNEYIACDQALIEYFSKDAEEITNDINTERMVRTNATAVATPTPEPTVVPTAEPTVEPTAEPTSEPTAEPAAVPTAVPIAVPTDSPTPTPQATDNKGTVIIQPATEKSDNSVIMFVNPVKTIKASGLSKSSQKFKLITVKQAQGKVTYKLIKNSIRKNIRKLVSISNKGVITINRWKKVKKGTYKIKVRVTAAGNEKYNAKTVTVAVKVKIR